MNIHGKNNFGVGTIGDQIDALRVALPNGESRRLQPRARTATLFHAAIGGFGMLAVITEVTLRLKRVHSGLLEVEPVPTRDLDEMFAAFEARTASADYLVGWVDGFATGNGCGRGLVHAARYLRARRGSAAAAVHAAIAEPGAAGTALRRAADGPGLAADARRSRTIPACAAREPRQVPAGAGRGFGQVPPVARGVLVPARLRARAGSERTGPAASSSTRASSPPRRRRTVLRAPARDAAAATRLAALSRRLQAPPPRPVPDDARRSTATRSRSTSSGSRSAQRGSWRFARSSTAKCSPPAAASTSPRTACCRPRRAPRSPPNRAPHASSS